MGAEVVGVPGLFYIYCGSSSLEAGLWSELASLGVSFGENLPVSQIWTVVGSTDSCVDVQGPLPSSVIWLWPRLSPTDLHE